MKKRHSSLESSYKDLDFWDCMSKPEVIWSWKIEYIHVIVVNHIFLVVVMQNDAQSKWLGSVSHQENFYYISLSKLRDPWAWLEEERTRTNVICFLVTRGHHTSLRISFVILPSSHSSEDGDWATVLPMGFCLHYQDNN